MTFRRADARDLVASILVAGVPKLAGRVHRARVWPMKLPDMPAALVYGWQETKTRRTLDMWTHQFEVACAMAIEGRVQAFDGPSVEIAMEALAGDIEHAILTDPQLLGLTGAIDRIDDVQTKLEAHAQGEIVQGVVNISFGLVWTEIHQATVPPNETTATWSVRSTPLPR